MTFESEGLLIVAIYTWLPPASYVVFSDNSGGIILPYLVFLAATGHPCFTNTKVIF